MKDKCKELDECLKHRFYKIRTNLRDTGVNNDTDEEEPQRPTRYQRISYLMNCYNDDEFQSLLTRHQDQFKCFQNLDRMTS